MLLGDVVPAASTVWAHPVYGQTGRRERVCAWSKEKIAHRIAKEARPDHDMVLSIGVGRVLPTLPKHLTGALLDIATVVPQVMRTEEILGREQYQQWLNQWEGKQWPWGIPIVRAWSFVDHPKADEVFPGLRSERFTYYHPEQMTTRLTETELGRLRALTVEPIVFELPIADPSGIAAQRLASARVRLWADRLAANIANRCRTRKDYVSLKPGFESPESDLNLLMAKLFQEQSGRCALCGGVLDISDGPNRLAQPSADRIDSHIKIYDGTNLHLTHLGCNLAKNEYPNDEALEFFRTWCGDGMDEPDAV
jgi:hypothetical protein